MAEEPRVPALHHDLAAAHNDFTGDINDSPLLLQPGEEVRLAGGRWQFVSPPQNPPTDEAAAKEADDQWGEAGAPLGPTAPSPLESGCDDLWTWNRWEHSPDVKLYGGGRIAHFHPNWSSGTAGARGTRILNNGRHYWELKLSQRIFGTSMMFGIGTKKARLHDTSFRNLLGEDANGWGLSHKGLLWHAGRWRQYTRPFRLNEPTTVGVLYDGLAGTLTYYKDGVCLGVAFSGLHLVQDQLYPVVCSTAAKTKMALQNTRREFVNLQDRCRAVIVKRLQSKWDLDRLWVPSRIRGYLAEAMPSKVPDEFSREAVLAVASYKRSSAITALKAVIDAHLAGTGEGATVQ